MSNYDLLVGMHQDRLNLIANQVYASDSLRKSLFSGSESGNYSGTAYSLHWSVDAAPKLSLRTPTTAEWSQAIKADGNTVAPQSGAFIVELSKLSIKLTTNSTDNIDTTIPVTAICTATADGTTLSVKALAVIVNLSQATAFDQFIISKVLVPAILNMLNQVLAGVQIPQISFAGISLTPPVVEINNGYLLTAFNLVKDGTPSIGNAALPTDSFFMLLSNELVQSTVDYEVRTNIQGQKYSQTGSESAAGFSANYHVWGQIKSISVTTTSNPVKLHANASLTMSASAGIDTPVNKVIDTITNPDTWNPSKW